MVKSKEISGFSFIWLLVPSSCGPLHMSIADTNFLRCVCVLALLQSWGVNLCGSAITLLDLSLTSPKDFLFGSPFHGSPHPIIPLCYTMHTDAYMYYHTPYAYMSNHTHVSDCIQGSLLPQLCWFGWRFYDHIM